MATNGEMFSDMATKETTNESAVSARSALSLDDGDDDVTGACAAC